MKSIWLVDLNESCELSVTLPANPRFVGRLPGRYGNAATVAFEVGDYFGPQETHSLYLDICQCSKTEEWTCLEVFILNDYYAALWYK